MNRLGRWFVQGLVAVLPIGITLAIFYWLGTSAEAAVGPVLRWLLPAGWYIPGLGVLISLVLITLVGLLVNAYLGRKLLDIANGLLSRIPLVSTFFDSVRDIAKFADPSNVSSEMQRAVLVPLSEDMRVVGFVTNEARQWCDGFRAVPVYVPMSYQLGGFTLLIPEDSLEYVDMDVTEAMRWTISAGMTGKKGGGAS